MASDIYYCDSWCRCVDCALVVVRLHITSSLLSQQACNNNLVYAPFSNWARVQLVKFTKRTSREKRGPSVSFHRFVRRWMLDAGIANADESSVSSSSSCTHLFIYLVVFPFVRRYYFRNDCGAMKPRSAYGNLIHFGITRKRLNANN